MKKLDRAYFAGATDRRTDGRVVRWTDTTGCNRLLVRTEEGLDVNGLGRSRFLHR